MPSKYIPAAERDLKKTREEFDEACVILHAVVATCNELRGAAQAHSTSSYLHPMTYHNAIIKIQNRVESWLNGEEADE